jgi:hypothetical protein
MPIKMAKNMIRITSMAMNIIIKKAKNAHITIKAKLRMLWIVNKS